jgi:hypothetical protein
MQQDGTQPDDEDGIEARDGARREKERKEVSSQALRCWEVAEIPQTATWGEAMRKRVPSLRDMGQSLELGLFWISECVPQWDPLCQPCTASRQPDRGTDLIEFELGQHDVKSLGQGPSWEILQNTADHGKCIH